MTALQSRYQSVLGTLPEGVTLVAVSKTHPAERIRELYEAGARIFGENRVQELVAKAEILPPNIQWHLIGHLQSNKVRRVMPYVHTIQSVDSEKLLETISQEAVKAGKTMEVYLQIKIAKEETKYGLTFQETQKLLAHGKSGHYPSVNISGLMGMATFTEDENQVRREFNSLKQFFDQNREEYGLKYLSMGMSGDYRLAIDCGSNSVRIGSAIFGERAYSL